MGENIVMSQWFKSCGASAGTSVNEIEEHLLMMASDAGSHASLTFRHQLPKSSHRCYRKPWSPPVRCRWKGWHTAMCRSRPIHYVLEECRDQTQTLQNVVRELYCESLFERLEVIILSRTFFCDALSLCGPYHIITEKLIFPHFGAYLLVMQRAFQV